MGRLLLMRFMPPLVPARLVRRYKRFLADAILDDGAQVTVHCPNPGSMATCLVPHARVWLSRSSDPQRKLPYTLEIIELGETSVFVNPLRANRVVEQALLEGALPALAGYDWIRREAPYSLEPPVGASERSKVRSRADFELRRSQPLGPAAKRYNAISQVPRGVKNREFGAASDPRDRCVVEVKNATLDLGEGQAGFPDSVTARGLRHLDELLSVHQGGARAVLLFCVSRTGMRGLRAAEAIDPAYAQRLSEVGRAGVEVMAYACQISPERVQLTRPLPVELG